MLNQLCIHIKLNIVFITKYVITKAPIQLAELQKRELNITSATDITFNFAIQQADLAVNN